MAASNYVKDKIKSAAHSGRTWDGKDGKTRFVIEVEFESGFVGEANAMSANPPYKTGDTVYYCINREYKNVPQIAIKKEISSQTNNNVGNRDSLILAQYCIREANLYTMNHGFPDKSNDTPRIDAKDRMEYITNVALGFAGAVGDVRKFIEDNDLHT